MKMKFVGLAGMDSSEQLRTVDPRAKPLKVNTEPRPEGQAPRSVQQYLLPHWRGKATRKQRKAWRAAELKMKGP